MKEKALLTGCCNLSYEFTFHPHPFVQQLSSKFCQILKFIYQLKKTCAISRLAGKIVMNFQLSKQKPYAMSK